MNRYVIPGTDQTKFAIEKNVLGFWEPKEEGILTSGLTLTIGEVVMIVNPDKDRCLRTSFVQEILETTALSVTFKTMNSIYRIRAVK